MADGQCDIYGCTRARTSTRHVTIHALERGARPGLVADVRTSVELCDEHENVLEGGVNGCTLFARTKETPRGGM